MKELSKYEIAAIKRTAQNVSMQRRKKAKLKEKLANLQAELEVINTIIDSFEAPIIKMTGGFTSEEVLNGAMEVAEATEAIPEGIVDETAVAPEIEVPVEEAVTIDPTVESPLALTGEDLGEDNGVAWGPITGVE